MKAIILAGGQGTRFWPLSSEDKPKQFLNLISNDSMLQETYQRFRDWMPAGKVFVVTTEKYLPLVVKQLPELQDCQIILEPDQRDTAPCIALTAMHFLNQKDDEVLVMAPSDQYIGNGQVFHKALTLAETVAEQNNSIVTLGIQPTGPETGYGYIKANKKTPFSFSAYQVEEFIEKPDLKKAEELISDENVFWNSGIFVWKPSTIAYNFSKHQPELWKIINDNQTKLQEVYSLLPKVSIDYAILEKAENVFTVPVNFEWDDIGSWTSLGRIHSSDHNYNYLIGDVMSALSKNCIVYSERKTLLIGVEDLIVASTDEGILVCHKSKEQTIKKFLNKENIPKNNFKDK
ncbi:mannose-1-phosphate guanylyltransferase [Cytobacillus praedii]|uniref:mannose-1-phosphate guanylyltransferase n=1 Tax=Cytobacillus praedii TaxID=1742358 RepID=A0A4R1ATZ3_9BACI|nr:mannose-1-phosphate guanylyltransferase [Cytobacillus praedii]MED3573241.1 mannose-1-phosphate guanylyltransferase [Cytobacillus praedii]TCJ01457.1 mannose-1-phosphate guanylyltransferase [Cytobacillus praedii]